MPADVALRRARGTSAAVLAQPSPLAAFAAAFRENRGAMIGLGRAGADRAGGDLRRMSSRRIRRSSSSASSCARRPSGPAGPGRFPLGTDGDGRDMLSRLIFGARISLFIGVSVMGVRLRRRRRARAAGGDGGLVRRRRRHAADGRHHGDAEPGAGGRRSSPSSARASPTPSSPSRSSACRAMCASRAPPRSAN